MIRKEKPKKKQHQVNRDSTVDPKPKGRSKSTKNKYRHFRQWLEDTEAA